MSVHGGWTEWQAICTCSKSCGSGIQSYERSCTNPSPAHNGNNCPENSSKGENCNPFPCSGMPINEGHEMKIGCTLISIFAVPCDIYGYNMNNENDKIHLISNVGTVGKCQYHCQQYSGCNFYKYHHAALGDEHVLVCVLFSADPGHHYHNHVSVGPKFR